ncbi:MAG: CPBP family intramembrane glutamic endopeptidase [Acidimicrobiia bacterium]
MVATAAVNAPLEELLWRGAFLDMFPDSVVKGAIWPLAGFSLWHLAPQIILPSRLGKLRFLAGATVVGAVAAMTVWRRRGLRPVLWSHFATDAMGVVAARFRLGWTDTKGH